jgi:hypothetical protein
LLDHVANDVPLGSDAKLVEYDRAAGSAQEHLANEVRNEADCFAHLGRARTYRHPAGTAYPLTSALVPHVGRVSAIGRVRRAADRKG